MQGVGAGRTIGDRYSLSERRAHLGTLEVWLATDNTLEREVSVTLFPLTYPRADAVMDAARRSAGVDDHRLVRVLDVGHRGQVAWVVEESLADSETLAQLLQDGPLPAEETRRVTGEIASALEVAARRGLHHLHLSPHAVRRTADGRIKLAGLATAAAIEGTEEPDAATAARIDTVGAIAIAYSAMTTRWPLTNTVPGLEPAPRIVGGVAAPSEIAGGVPADLDTLCRQTLNAKRGPRTPGELAAQIAPWSPTRVRHVAARTPFVAHWGPEGQPGGTEQAHGPVAGPAVAPAHGEAPSAEAGTAAGARTTGTPSTVVPAGSRGGRGRPDEHHPEGPDDADAPHRRDQAARAAAGTVAVEAVTGKVGSFARAAADRASARRELKAAEREAQVAAVRAAAEEERALTLRINQALDQRRVVDETPAPLLPPQAGGLQDGAHSRLVLAVVAATVIISMIIAVPTLFRAPSPPEAAPAPTVSASQSTGAAPTSSASNAAPSGSTIEIARASGYDPMGDRAENNQTAWRAFDGDPSTMWTSEGYLSGPSFTGNKSGVGVILTLKERSTVRNVTLTLAEQSDKPQNVDVYVSEKRAFGSLDNATKIGSLSDATGTQTITASETPDTTRYVIVWFTKVAPDNEKFRAMLSEVALS